jgi:hypothetical protein
LRSSIQSWKFVNIFIIIIGVKGIRNNKGEKKLLIIDEKDEFDQDIFVVSNNFRTKYEKNS